MLAATWSFLLHCGEPRAALGKEAGKQLRMQKESVDTGKARPSLRLWGRCCWMHLAPWLFLLHLLNYCLLTCFVLFG